MMIRLGESSINIFNKKNTLLVLLLVHILQLILQHAFCCSGLSVFNQLDLLDQSRALFFSQGFPGQQYGSGMGAAGPYPGQAMQYHGPGPQRSAPSPSYTGHRMPLQQSNMGQYPAGTGNPGQYYKVKQPWLTYNRKGRYSERFWQLSRCLFAIGLCHSVASWQYQISWGWGSCFCILW